MTYMNSCHQPGDECDKVKALLLESGEYRKALEWCVRVLKEIGGSRGLVADHGDALDNALVALDGRKPLKRVEPPQKCETCDLVAGQVRYYRGRGQTLCLDCAR